MEFIKSSLVLASFERQNSKRSIRTDLFIFFIAFFLNVIFLSLLLSHKEDVLHLSSVEFILNGPFYWLVLNDEIPKDRFELIYLFFYRFFLNVIFLSLLLSHKEDIGIFRPWNSY